MSATFEEPDAIHNSVDMISHILNKIYSLSTIANANVYEKESNWN